MTEADCKIETWLNKLADAYDKRASEWDDNARLAAFASLPNCDTSIEISEKLAIMSRDSATDIRTIIKEHYEKHL